MRIGQNPAKLGLPAYSPKAIGIALLTYIPWKRDYFSQSLEILKIQIASIYHTTSDFDLYVFDNGSSSEVQNELRQMHAKGIINFLFLSQFNIGKTGMLNWILSAIPNELICYSDSDVLFRPGWLENSKVILNAYPSAGIVTAQPCLFDIMRGKGKAHLELKNNPSYKLEQGHLDHDVIEEYLLGVGQTVESNKSLFTNQVQMVRDLASGERSVIGASHMQFVIPRSVARKIVPLPAAFALSRDEDAQLNLKVDQAGFLHLSTLKAYVFHMGNRINDRLINEVKAHNLDVFLKDQKFDELPKPARNAGKLKKWGYSILNFLGRFSMVRKIFERLYIFLFEYYTQVRS